MIERLISTPRRYDVSADVLCGNLEPRYPGDIPIARLTGSRLTEESLTVNWTAGYGFHDNIPIDPKSKGSGYGRVTAIAGDHPLEIFGVYAGNRNKSSHFIGPKHFMHLMFFIEEPSDKERYEGLARDIAIMSTESLAVYMRSAWGIESPVKIAAGFKSRRRPQKTESVQAKLSISRGLSSLSGLTR